MQRARGKLALHIDGDKIKTLYQAGCAKLMLPKTYGAMKEAVILNTAGGITGGDRLDIELKAEACPLRCDNADCRKTLPQQHVTGENFG